VDGQDQEGAAAKVSAGWLEPARGGTYDAAVALVRAAFPETALPEARTRALLNAGRYRMAVARAAEAGDAGEALAGVAVLAVFAEEGFCHLDYLATAEGQRRRGVATALWDLVRAQAPAGCTRLTLEVDESLVDFYRRRGARRLEGVRYLFPATEPPMPMELMVAACGAGSGAAVLPVSMDGVAVRRIIAALYQGLHGRDAADALLAAVLAGVPPVVRLT
jgi:ribosomal protein S18 acetylase RimI-like enzyme